MKFRAAIFDLDGTLLDTIEDLTDSMNAALAAMGHPTKTVAECKNLVGDGLEIFIRRSLPPSCAADPAAARKLRELIRAEYRRRHADKTRPYPGIREMLDGMIARGIPISVLSNKPHDSTLEVVARHFPGIKFECVFGHRDDVPAKPDPSGALEIARRLGLRPAEVLYVGDTNTDMQTAAAAGMFAAGVLWGFRTADELRKNGAGILVAKPAELLDLFG
ncbi:MAG: HAD family hydrolase [Candidatus Aminicenantales bacterium]